VNIIVIFIDNRSYKYDETKKKSTGQKKYKTIV